MNKRKELSLKMGHTFTTNLQNGKNMINIDDTGKSSLFDRFIK
jgi:hypothetical protein